MGISTYNRLHQSLTFDMKYDLNLPVYFELFVLSVDILGDDEDVFRLGEGL